MDSNLIIILGNIRNTRSIHDETSLCDTMGKVIKASNKHSKNTFPKSWLCDIDTSVECLCFNCPISVFADTWLEVLCNEAKLIEDSNNCSKRDK